MKVTSLSLLGNMNVRCYSLLLHLYHRRSYILANVGPWKKLAARKGAVIKYWNPKPTLPVNPYSVALAIPDLLPLISFRTRIVAFTACSNILGSIIPVEEVVKAIRERAAKEGTKKLEICVDCVAYAPHRKIDVQKWDVDYCYFSFYKVRFRSAMKCISNMT
jgi:selenocysteine lyase/cysteine desulfurase